MTDIFISYATEDRERVRELVSKLEGHGWSIWWDREIKTGKSFEREIETAIDSAKCILVVWSHASVESEWVRTEANEGLDRKILIPITIDDVRPPLAYRRLQTAFLMGWPAGNHEAEFLRLTASIHMLLDTKNLHDRDTTGLDGERRYISVLTCNVTERLEIEDPEISHEQNNRFKEIIRQLVTKFRGYLYQFTGSNFVVVFGIPSMHEEDTLYAVNLALHIQKHLKKSIRQMTPVEGNRISVECSITRGLVIASRENKRINEYSITGNVIHEGAQLLDLASQNEILVSESAYKVISSYVQANEKVIGNEHIYKIQSTSLITSRIEAAEAKGFTEFCGRETETAHILDRYSSASKGFGQVVTLIGEAGIGKSRLLYEVRKRLPAKEVFLLEGRCQSYGSHTAYYPYLGMLRQYLRLSNVPAVELHNATVKAILSAFPGLEQYIPHYLYLLSIPSDTYRLPTHLQGESMRLALQDALVSILAVISKQKPLVILFEDWHWADDASTAVLHHLIHIAVSLPMLIIISCRPEYHPAWASLEHSSLLKVNSFSMEHTHKMIALLSDAEDIPMKFVEHLHHRTGGNPFFIEELCTSLFEQGKIHSTKGKLTVKNGIENLDLPDSVQVVLRTRLDQLDREAQEILYTASVIGREFSRRLLELSCGKMVDPVLRGLVEIGIISQTRIFPNPEYIFKHALIQVVAYETLLFKYRKKLHQIVAKNILELYPESIIENTEVLAYHFALSDDNDNAIKFTILAGERALARSAHRESIEHLRKAEQILVSMPDNRPTQLLKLRIVLSLGPALILAHGYSDPEVIATYLKASEYSKLLGANDQMFAALWGLWRYYNASSLMDRATELAYQLLEIGNKNNKTEQQHSAYAAIIVSETFNGNIHKALNFMDSLRATYDLETERDLAIHYGLSPMVLGLSLGASSKLFAGDYKRATVMNEEALEICKQIDHSGSEVMGLFYAASTRLMGGEIKKEIQFNTRLLEIAESEKFIHWIALGRFNEARDTLLTGGDIQKVLPDLVEKANFAVKVAPASKASSSLTLASVFMAIGKAEESMKFIEEGQHVLHLFTPEFLRLKAQLLYKVNKQDALIVLDEAWKLAVEKNNLFWQLKILMSRIQWSAVVGKLNSDDVDLLTSTMESFSKDSFIPEVVEAKKYLCELMSSSKNHTLTDGMNT
ncbi:MAG: TIR domain-containing protein [Cyclobacteriaceae bacterium]